MVRPGEIGIHVAEAGDPVEYPVAFELDAQLIAFVLRRHDHHLARGEVLAILAFLALEREHIVTSRDQANGRCTSGRSRSNYDNVSVEVQIRSQNSTGCPSCSDMVSARRGNNSWPSLSSSHKFRAASQL